MQEWMVFVFLSLGLYGLWAFLPKIASSHLDSRTILVMETLGSGLIVLLVLLSLGGRLEVHKVALPISIIAGSCGALGSLFFLMALPKGNTSVVVTATALYPLIVIFLSAIFLKETISLRQGIGIALALAAMVLFSMK